MIEIEIDGKKLQTAQGAMIIQAADEAGIYIPRFCYHKKLSIAANCRMCLVEVEKAPKTLPACATPVAPGMKVFTQSQKAITSQKYVMEFLLINHPLDCPICDQGGECELQDLAMGYGRGISRFTEGKRSFKDKDLGPLISSEMTRCIQCTRCVRFGDEIAGMRELGATGRGDTMEISTYIQHAMQSEISGNIIDICPVGALTSKPYRFTARAWEMQQHPAIAPHDCLGSNIFIHTRGEEYSSVRSVMRVVPRENESINETWISDRDRYSYEGINSLERITQPLIKEGQEWKEVDWATALHEAAQRINGIARQGGPEQIGGLASPSATLEESYLFQSLLRNIGSNNIDHRLQQTDFTHQEHAPLYPALGMQISALETLDVLLLLGSDVRREQPLASQRIRKAKLKNKATIISISPVDYDFNFTVDEKQIVGGWDFILSLAKLLKAICNKTSQPIPMEIAESLRVIEAGAAENSMAEKLLSGKNTAVLLGAYALNHRNSAILHALANAIADRIHAKIGSFTPGANAAGAWLSGVLPHRGPAGKKIDVPGLNARQMFEKPLQGYLLLGVEPELDSAYSAQALHALKSANTVIVLTSFRGGAVEEYADIILPIASFAETSGTYVNAEGQWQAMQAATLPLGDARPAWKVLCALADFLNVSGFHYDSSEQIRDELKSLVDNMPEPIAHLPYLDSLPEKLSANVYRLAEWPMYRIDTLVRRAKSLQATMGNDVAVIRIHSKLAQRLHLQDGAVVTAVQKASRVTLPLRIDDRIAAGHVSIPCGLDITAGFGEAMGEIELHEV